MLVKDLPLRRHPKFYAESSLHRIASVPWDECSPDVELPVRGPLRAIDDLRAWLPTAMFISENLL